MPNIPVATSSPRRCHAAARAGSGAAACGAAAGKASAAAAQARFSTAHTAAVRASPKDGSSQKAVASTPATAPSVLAAYSPAMALPRRPWAATRPARAGSVAPIAAVAGSSSRKLPPKASHHWRNGPGSGPAACTSAWLAGASPHHSTAAHSAISTSHAAYQRAGRRLRSMRAPNAKAPSASPPKKAATTASTAACSWPSHSALCRVHTIW